MATVKINNQQELENAINNVAANLDEAEVCIPFGEFKGYSIEVVPNYYLEWLLSNDFLENKSCYGYLLKPIEKEIKYREEFGINIIELEK